MKGLLVVLVTMFSRSLRHICQGRVNERATSSTSEKCI